MTDDRMIQLAQTLASAKSRQDVEAAMKLFHPDMHLESPFGTSARGLPANEAALRRFFVSFPDYEVVLEGHASNAGTLTCWGTAQMTMTGNRFGVIPNGRRAKLRVYIQFTFKDGLIASEYFFFDLSELCSQSGVSTDAVRQKLFREPIQAIAGGNPMQG